MTMDIITFFVIHFVGGACLGFIAVNLYLAAKRGKDKKLCYWCTMLKKAREAEALGGHHDFHLSKDETKWIAEDVDMLDEQ